MSALIALRAPFAASIIGLSLLVACGDKGSTDDTAGDAGNGNTGEGGYTDTDGDTILDIHEGTDDADGDGTANHEDEDSDDDTILDRTEAGDSDVLTLPIDSDSDGISDFLDTDSDNNCVSDADEKNPSGSGPGDADGDGTPDYTDPDNDGDGLDDALEIGLNCAQTDTDADGTPDFQDIDSDGDGVGDVYEAGTTEWDGNPADTDGDGTPDYQDDDSDGDGILDSEESGVTSPTDEPRDTDGDGVYDFKDLDSDGDSLNDDDELNYWGTDPYDPDTDGDGFSDGGEITAGTDPLDDTSVIDGIYVEVPERTQVEESFVFEANINLGDIAFLIDTTGSMSGTADAMAAEFSKIVGDINGTIPDAQYGVAQYDDYAESPYGYTSSGDKPFILLQQMTDDTSGVQSLLSGGICCHYGGDGPESSMEALYQGASGEGYDQECTGSYDATTDVLPFLSSTSDPFGGSGGESFDSSSSGGGDIGGFGFREGALPILIYATDYDLRDPDNGYPSPNGCPQDAGTSDVVKALEDIGGYVIGVQVGSYTTTPYTQMVQLSHDTESYADTDADGDADDPLAFQWSGSNTAFRNTITGAVEDLVTSIRFERVELGVEGDEWDFVTSVSPDYYDDIDPNDTEVSLNFTLEFRGVVAATTEDQLFKLTLNIMGDETVLLDTLDIIVRVPGNSY